VFSTRPPVSVCGTGTGSLTRGFSWQCDHRDFGTVLPSPSQLTCRLADLPASPAHCLDGLFHSAASLDLLRHPIAQTLPGGTGISTSCPSTTPFGLALGPDLPWADDPSPGTLGLSADRILTCLFATYTGILTSVRSTKLHNSASPPTERSPTMHRCIQSFGVWFSPVTFSAQRHSTSELLRTL
jgi:hypothetical protein